MILKAIAFMLEFWSGDMEGFKAGYWLSVGGCLIIALT